MAYNLCVEDVSDEVFRPLENLKLSNEELFKFYDDNIYKPLGYSSMKN